MPRCSHCGKVNREGSLFCQDCGHRLDATPNPAAAKAAIPTCSACGTANPPGMNFCKTCGSSLAGRGVSSGAPASVVVDMGSSEKSTCPACGKQTPAGFAFCQHCGQRLGAPPAAASPRSASTAAPAAPLVGPTPPAGMPPPVLSSARPPSANGEVQAARVAPVIASIAAPAPAPALARSVAPAGAAVSRDTFVDPPVLASAPVGSLVAIHRDGSDKEKVPLTGESFDIGRTEGELRFLEDPYLAPRHARLILSTRKVVLRPLDAVNGVYLRVQGSADLAPGDQFIVGKELLRYEPLVPEERDPPSLVEHGVRIFGTVPREAWGRLRQLTASGTTRDLWHLTRGEWVLGREEGDVTFPDDEFMSRRHAALRTQGGKVRLEDLSSSNGTFLRVRGDRELKAGDVLRMGDQLLRFET